MESNVQNMIVQEIERRMMETNREAVTKMRWMNNDAVAEMKRIQRQIVENKDKAVTTMGGMKTGVVATIYQWFGSGTCLERLLKLTVLAEHRGPE